MKNYLEIALLFDDFPSCSKIHKRRNPGGKMCLFRNRFFILHVSKSIQKNTIPVRDLEKFTQNRKILSENHSNPGRIFTWATTPKRADISLQTPLSKLVPLPDEARWNCENLSKISRYCLMTHDNDPGQTYRGFFFLCRSAGLAVAEPMGALDCCQVSTRIRTTQVRHLIEIKK